MGRQLTPAIRCLDSFPCGNGAAITPAQGCGGGRRPEPCAPGLTPGGGPWGQRAQVGGELCLHESCSHKGKRLFPFLSLGGGVGRWGVWLVSIRLEVSSTARTWGFSMRLRGRVRPLSPLRPVPSSSRAHHLHEALRDYLTPIPSPGVDGLLCTGHGEGGALARPSQGRPPGPPLAGQGNQEEREQLSAALEPRSPP